MPETLISASDTAGIAATCKAHSLSSEQFNQLRDLSMRARGSAYCVYSDFRVGACLLGADGTSFTTGANIENASYPVGTCAERAAFAKVLTDMDRFATAATARGQTSSSSSSKTRDPRRGGLIKAVAVASDISPPISPCGMCRQFMREFCELDVPIIMFDKNKDFVVMTMGELLPMSFGPDVFTPPGAPGT